LPVVVAIIAALAALILAAVQSAAETSKSAKCVANFRQFFLLANTYLLGKEVYSPTMNLETPPKGTRSNLG
jgi:hypothetical protein